MLILDTDHLSVLDRGGMQAKALVERLEPRRAELGTTIVSVGEQLQGLLSLINSARGETQLFDRYDRLWRTIDLFSTLPVIGWTPEASVEFEGLRRQRIRIGTMDLRIASIAIANGATLLTRNLKDFARVPGLRAENWIQT